MAGILASRKAEKVKLSDIAARLDCVLKGDGELEIARVIGIEEAETGDVTFVSNPKYAAKARTTKASAVIVTIDFPDIDRATLRSPNPYLTFARAVELFYQAPLPVQTVFDDRAALDRLLDRVTKPGLPPQP